MTKKEREQEQREIAEAVKVMRVAIHSLARKKAERYEHEFLIQVRDEIDRIIAVNDYVVQHSAEYIGQQVTETLLKE